MTVTNLNNKISYVGDGSTTVWAYPYPFQLKSDLQVYVNNELLSAGYTVETLADYSDGANITFDVAPDNGISILFRRNTPITQEISYPENDPFPAKSHEKALDKLTMIVGNLNTESLKINPAASEIFDPTFPIPEANKALKINADGNGFTMSDFDPDTALAVTEEYKNQAQAAAQAAANSQAASATNAANSLQYSNNAAISEANALQSENEATTKAGEALASQQAAAISETNAAESLAEMTHILDTSFAESLQEAINDLSQTGQAYLQDLAPNNFITFNDRRKLKILKNVFIPLVLESTGETLWFTNLEDIVINVEELLDEGTNLINGKPYSIFLVPNADSSEVELKVSLNSTAPTDYTPGDTRRIGGFHTECADVGNVTWYSNHPLSGWLAGDILPQSVWTIYHRPYASPNNMIYIPGGIPFWRTIYDHAGTLGTTSFEFGGTVTRSRTYYGHHQDMIAVGLQLPTYEQATISAVGCEALKAIMGKSEAASTQAGGHVNESNHRITSIYGAEDCCGVTWKPTTIAAIGGSNWSTDASVGVHQYGSVQVLHVGGRWADSGNAGPFATAGHNSALAADSSVASFGVSYPMPRKSIGQ